jgi:hypothetical protein
MNTLIMHSSTSAFGLTPQRNSVLSTCSTLGNSDSILIIHKRPKKISGWKLYKLMTPNSKKKLEKRAKRWFPASRLHGIVLRARLLKIFGKNSNAKRKPPTTKIWGRELIYTKVRFLFFNHFTMLNTHFSRNVFSNF